MPEVIREPNLESLLAEFWEQIFETELGLWMEEEQTWPQARSRHMFDAWFESEVTSSVCDLTPEEPLTHDEVEGSSRCEKGVRKAVPRALRRLTSG